MTAPLVSAVVLNWNTSDETLACVRALERQDFEDMEVVVVENGSRADEKEKVLGLRGSVRVVDLKQNRGFTGGANAGWAQSRGEKVMFLNNDALPAPDLVGRLSACVRGRVAAAVPKVLRWDGRRAEHAGGGRLTVWGLPLVRRSDGGAPEPEPTGLVKGACFMVSKDAVRSTGEPFPFCPHYFTYFEEVDLSWRLRSAGWEIAYCPSAVVRHAGGASVRRNGSETDRISCRNKYLTYWRNLPRAQFAAVLPLMVACDLARSAKRRGYLRSFSGGLSDFEASKPLVRTPRRGSLRDLRLW